MRAMKTSFKQISERVVDFFKFLFSLKFVRNLLYIVLFYVVVIFLVLQWLKFYTNHGQKIEMPNYVDMKIDEASEDAEDRSFQIMVNDSVHIVGREGGLIINQNPKPGAKVKENRKIYVDVTKYIADQIAIKSLPNLYGNDYERKKKELSYTNIGCRVRSYKYDIGEPNHVLEVWYKGELVINNEGRKNNVMINKGDTLEFVLSKSEGAQILVPDLVCKNLSEAKYLLEANKLKLGIISGEMGSSEASSFITEQSPASDGISTALMGSTINVWVAGEKPIDCR